MALNDYIIILHSICRMAAVANDSSNSSNLPVSPRMPNNVYNKNMDDPDMKTWFNALEETDKKELAQFCRWYAWHCDSYLNSVYRLLGYPKSKLIKHIEDFYTYGIDNTAGKHKFTTFDKTICKHVSGAFIAFIKKRNITRKNNNNNNNSTKKSLTKNNAIKDSIIKNYIARINEVLLTMNAVIMNPIYSYVTTKEITVYRGIHILEEFFDETHIKLAITGATSVSTSKSQAINFAKTIYDKNNNDMRAYKYILFEITLPTGIRVIPANICTIQQEYELIVISQGHLTNIAKTYMKLSNNNTNINNNPFKLKYNFICIKGTFQKDNEFPTYTEFNVI